MHLELVSNQPTSKELTDLDSLIALNQLIYSTLQTILSNIEFHKGLKELFDPNNPNPALLLTKPKLPKPRELALSLPESSRLELEENQQPQVDFFDTPINLNNPESYIFTVTETNSASTTITNSSDNDNLGNERSGNKSDTLFNYDNYVDSDTSRYGGDDKDSILGYDYYGNDPYLGQEEIENQRNNIDNNNPPFKSEADIVDDILNLNNDDIIKDIDDFLDKMFGSNSNGRNADKTTPDNQKEGQPKSFKEVKRDQQEKRDNEIKEADNLAKAQQQQVETLKEVQESDLRIADLQRRIDELNQPKEAKKIMTSTRESPITPPQTLTISEELQLEQSKLQDLSNQITILENTNTKLLQIINNPNLSPQAIEVLVNKIDSNLTKAGELRLERKRVEKRIEELRKKESKKNGWIRQMWSN